MWLSRLENHNEKDGPRCWWERRTHDPGRSSAGHMFKVPLTKMSMCYMIISSPLNLRQAHCTLQTANTECNVTRPRRTDSSKLAFLQRFRPAPHNPQRHS